MHLQETLSNLKTKNTRKKVLFPDINDNRIYEAVKKLLELWHSPVVCWTKQELERYKNLSELQKIENDSSLSNNDFWAQLLHDWKVDGFLSGNLSPTAEVVKSLYRWVWMQTWVWRFSSYFLMQTELWLKIFADCAVQVEPDAKQLAEIAFLTVKSALSFDLEPKTAMLSFSTYGSASHAYVEKVQQATKIARELLRKYDIDAIIDWEMQLDAAIIPKIAQKKAPNSPLMWDANVLIFPDLNSGNIGYKLVQRFWNAQAIWPILQWLSKPANDLSRGCSVDDILAMYYITANQ